MLKKKNWMCVIKRLFYPETTIHQHPQKRSKRRKWLFGRLKKNKRLPSLPSPPPQGGDVEEIQGKSVPNVSISISGNEVEGPKCVESVMSINEGSPRDHQCEIVNTTTECLLGFEEVQMYAALPLTKDIEEDVSGKPTELQIHRCVNQVINLTAIKIQSSYRGYLARKALRAMKGIVRLQAIIRGELVRRQAMHTLKCLQAIVSIQSEVCTKRRNEMVHVKHRNLHLQSLNPTDDNPKAESPRSRRLDDRLLTKDEEIDIILRKKEAILRRQSIKAYSFNHRNSVDSEDAKAEARLRYWLEQHANDKAPDNDNKKHGGKHHNSRNSDGGLCQRHIISLPRRSLQNHVRQNSHCEDCIHPDSPSTASIPAYMAATESAKAKTRSASTPRVRSMYFEAYSDGDSPYKHKVSPMSSINSDATCLSKYRLNKSGCSSQQKSPSLRGLPSSIRTSRNNIKDINLDYDSLLVNRRSR